MKNYLLGLDIGTSGAKTILLRIDGTECAATAEYSYRLWGKSRAGRSNSPACGGMQLVPACGKQQRW